MAIRLRNSKREKQPGDKKRDYRWVVTLLALCVLVTMALYPAARRYVPRGEMERSQSWPSFSSDERTDLKSFIRYIYMGSYGMFHDLEQTSQLREIRPVSLFFPSYSEEEGSGIGAEFDEAFAQWYAAFSTLMESYDVQYQISRSSDGAAYSNTIQDLSALPKEDKECFFMTMSFDAQGNVTLLDMKNEDQIQLTAAEVGGISKARFLDWIDSDLCLSASMLQPPQNVDVYVYSEDPTCYHSRTPEGIMETIIDESKIYETVGSAYWLLLILIAVCACFLPAFRRIRQNSSFVSQFPLEFALLAVLLCVPGQELLVNMCGVYLEESSFFRWLEQAAVLTLVYGAWMTALLVLLQVRELGIKGLLREKSFLYRHMGNVYVRLKKRLAQFWDTVKEVDFSSTSDRWVFRLVAVNFLILLVCCMLWFWGVFGLLVYSVILFFTLRKYLGKVKKQYYTLYGMTIQMAQGNLKMEIREDLGIFEPLKRELAKVNTGFQKAVEEETRSQNMKTELITNVSHDLKTPLTAIITYVNLLKDETITEEERRAYVDILDRKSLRLKKLFEDLFEISKAASGNIEIHKSRINLSEMVRQAVAEQEDCLQQAQIECRIATPEEPVYIELDGEKTYRILENLLVNVSKYALAGTRAWVSLTQREQTAVITVKNISATELDGDSSVLTERFVRGDKARHSEGSGLGLAIVKSFAELQGGSFEIVTDADLFKAMVTFQM